MFHECNSSIAEIAETTNVRTSFTLDVVQVMIKLPQCQGILQATQELAFVDLDLLNTNANRISFYVNVLNLMWIHGIIHEVLLNNKHRRLSIKGEGDRHPITSMESGIGLLSPVASFRCSSQSSFCYKIGQLGTIRFVLTNWFFFFLFSFELGMDLFYLSHFKYCSLVVLATHQSKRWLKFTPRTSENERMI